MARKKTETEPTDEAPAVESEATETEPTDEVIYGEPGEPVTESYKDTLRNTKPWNA